MRKILLLLILSAQSSFGETIDPSILSGLWIDSWLRYQDEIEPERRSRIRNKLHFRPDGNIVLDRTLDGEDFTYSEATPDDSQWVDDLLIVDFRKEGKPHFKLVVSGWSYGDDEDRSSMIFGHLYVYDGSELINGIPVGFEPANQSAE